MNLPIKQETRDITQAIGDTAEENFMIALYKKGWPFDKSTQHEDMHHHIDFWVQSPNNTRRSFDVKAYKKSAKQGNLLIEFKNVSGNKGWLYGKADFIAFDFNDHFLCVVRSELAQLAESLCDLTQKVDNINKALYKSYGRERWGRGDQVSLIKIEDVKENLNYFTIEY